MIPEEKIAEIRERVDIVSAVEEYVRLRRVGTSFKGLCPFHDEKTPSFHVHRDRGYFHCFGCKASGDIFAFLMRMEGRSFIEVLQELAERTGVELPESDPNEDAERRRARQQRDRLAALMDAAAGFYVRALSEHPHAGIARAEYRGRGILDETARAFRLGYAPAAWDELAAFLRAGGHSPADAEALGLIVPRRSGDGHYDRFRHRLLFPIADLHGRIIAFSGRALAPPPGAPDEPNPPAKYVNSPEGPLYTKGDILFGLHEARVPLRRESRALVCEGNFDLIALHQAGFKNAVAPLGTAFTEAQAKLIRRFASKVDLLFDSDAAGRKAVRAAFPLLMRAGLAAKVVVLPEKADPDSFLREQGADALRARIEASRGIVDHLVDEAAAESAGDPRAQADAIAGLGPILAALDSPVEARLQVERVARRFGIHDLDAVRRELRRGLGRPRGEPRRQREAPEPSPKASAPAPVLPPMECELLSVILDNPALARTENAKNLVQLLTSNDLRGIFQTVAGMVEARGGIDAASLLMELSGNPATAWLEERLAIHKYDQSEGEQALHEGIGRLAQQNIERELPRLQRAILDARRVGDDARATALTQEYGVLFRSSIKLQKPRGEDGYEGTGSGHGLSN